MAGKLFKNTDLMDLFLTILFDNNKNKMLLSGNLTGNTCKIYVVQVKIEYA